MSLQVWLPLNGNTKNQGLNDVQPSIGSNAIDSNGKIGSCIKVTSTIDTLLPSSDWDYASGNVSFGCWAYISKSELQSLVSNATFTSTNTSMGGTLLGRNSYGGLGLRWKTNNIYSSETLSSVLIYTRIRNTNSNINNTSSYTIPFDTWTHIMTVCDRTNSKLSLYINGELFSSVNLTVTGSFSTGNFLICQNSWDSGNGVSSSGCWKLNDVRIYDHCLSSLEIKQISQGLVCHYKLSGIGGENIVNTSSPLISGGNTSVSNNTVTLKYKTGGSLDTYFYLNITENLISGNTYTISCDASGLASGESCSFGMISQGSGKNFIINKNGRNSAILVPTSDVSDKFIFDDVLKGTSDIVLSNFKIEIGDKVTSWCPNKADTLYSTLGYSDNIEYDTSGYENNGTKTGTIKWSGDTSRYSGSYIPTTTSTYITTPLITSGYSNSYTFSYWTKISNMSGRMVWGFGNGNRLNVYPTSAGFCWNTGDGGSNPFQNNGTNIDFTPYNGAWHHYAITGDGTTTTLYIDGEKKGTAKTYKAITGTQLYISGWDTGTSYKWTNGNISDFRIYATCLSESDIKQLYCVPASINKTGILSAYEFVEVD